MGKITIEFDENELYECDCDGDCENCSECDGCDIGEVEKAGIDLILETIEEIRECECKCDECLTEILRDLTDKFYNIGYADAKAEMQAMLDDLD